jgi:hypothetical protein
MKKVNRTPAALGALVKGDLENFVVAATPGGIEQQEAEGQRSFVASQSLPKDCPRADLEALGFVFGADIDELFVSVNFPTGWSKKATDHSMWSELLDDKHRRRGGIFYKAAFYDRKASMHLDCRYCVRTSYPAGEGPVRISVQDWDGTVLFDLGEARNEDWKARDAAQEKGVAWLSEHFPEWKSPTAYWGS